MRERRARKLIHMIRQWVFIAAFLVGTPVWAEQAPATQPMNHDHHTHHKMMDATAPVAGASIYQLKATLLDQQGNKAGLDQFKGGPVVVTMFFAACTQVCPMQVSRMKQLESKLSETARAKTRNLLVTFDAERDTPAALAEFAKKYGVDQTRWKFVSTSADSLREIAAALGFKYQKLPDGSYNHSAIILALDAAGVPVARVEGLTASLDELVAAIEQRAAPAGPSKSK